MRVAIANGENNTTNIPLSLIAFIHRSIMSLRQETTYKWFPSERAYINGFDHNTMQVIASENILWASWIEQRFEDRDILGRKLLLLPWIMKVAVQLGL